MALIDCKECGKEISDKAKSCIHCGAPIESDRDKNLKGKANTKQKKKELGLGKIILIIIIAFVAMIYFAEKNRNAPPEEMLETAICETLIKEKLQFPSTFNSKDFLGVPMIDETKDGIIIKIKFEAKNGVGNSLPYLGRCLQTKTHVKFLDIKQR